MSCVGAFLANEELFHQVNPFPQSSLAPTASRIKSKPLSWNPRPSTGWLQTALSTVFFHRSPLWIIKSSEAGLHLFPFPRHTSPGPERTSCWAGGCFSFQHGPRFLPHGVPLASIKTHPSKHYVNFKALLWRAVSLGKNSLTIQIHSDLFLPAPSMIFSF